MRTSILSLSFLTAANGLPSQQLPLKYPSDGRAPFDASFDELIKHTMKQWHVPGMSIAVVKGNDTFTKGYGYARLADKRADENTLYYTGSTTKSFTAASILKLIEEQTTTSAGRLSLQSKIEDTVPWKLQDEYVQTHATLEDALSHRTGMPRHDMSYGETNFTHQDMINSLQYLPLTKEIRQEWQYCNMMFIVLSQAVEKLSGTTFAKFVKKNIWEPLGMHNTFMDLDAAEKSGNLATGYFYDNGTGKYLPHEYQDPVFLAGAGGTISSVSDYAKYLRAMLHEDPAILTAASYRELKKSRIITPPLLPDPAFIGPDTYGLGWFFSTYKGVQIIHHSGGVPGFTTNMLYAPTLDWAVVAITNADQGGGPLVYLSTFGLLDRALGNKEETPDVSAIWEALLKIRLDVMKQLREIAFPEAPSPNDALPPALRLDAYTGSYFNQGYRFVNLTLVPPTTYVGVPIPTKDGKMLHADMTDRAWKHVLDFEHVNAEHFLVRWHYLLPEAKNFDLETEAMRAEFEIGSDSKVKRLGLGYEPLMGSEMIWFDKVD